MTPTELDAIAAECEAGQFERFNHALAEMEGWTFDTPADVDKCHWILTPQRKIFGYVEAGLSGIPDYAHSFDALKPIIERKKQEGWEMYFDWSMGSGLWFGDFWRGEEENVSHESPTLEIAVGIALLKTVKEEGK